MNSFTVYSDFSVVYYDMIMKNTWACQVTYTVRLLSFRTGIIKSICVK